MENRIAIIDLGSNSARLVIYSQGDRGLIENEDIKQVPRLSSHLRDGIIDDAGIGITLDCMKQFKQLCDARSVTEITAVATAAVRQATNGAEIVNLIREKTGISFRILTGEEEATYGYLSVANSMSLTDAITVDIGGGSTELTLMQGRQCLAKVSFPFGAVTLTERFFASDTPSATELEALNRYVHEQFSNLPWLHRRGLPLVALGGAARTLGNIDQKKRKYPFGSLHQYAVNAQNVTDHYHLLTQTPLEKRRKIKGMSKDRADIIIASVTVFVNLLSLIGSRELVVSTKGLREGILFERILHDRQQPLFDDVALYSTQQLMQRYQVSTEHSEHVAALAVSLFDQMRAAGLVRAGDGERKLLHIAALLHDVGRSINVYETHQHTFYLLSNVLLTGLSHKERLIIALLAAYKSDKKLDKQAESYQSLLNKEEVERIKTIAPILTVARALDRSMTQPVRGIQLRQTNDGYTLVCAGTKRDLMEYALLREHLENLGKTYQHPFAMVPVPAVE